MSNQSVMEMGQQYIMHTYGRLSFALVRGEGARVWDADGKEYLDFVGGLAVNSLGHCHPAVAEAVATQARTLIHCSNLYWIEPQARLAKVLVENSDLAKVFFCNSGAEANEGAIKLARKYAKKHLGQDAFEIITMHKSFHGRTLATLTATGQAKFHQGFDPLPQGFRYVPYNDLAALEQAIGPHTCAVMLEPVQGEGGVYPADPAYMKSVRKLCDERGLLLIMDEVQTGLGRTGKLFGYQHFGITPDVMTLAKALGGGVPIGALLAKESVAAAFQPGDHASTFGGNPLACAAGLAAMGVILEEGLAENAARVGAYFKERLQELQSRFTCIKEVRGMGLILGVELNMEGGPVVAACQQHGLLINCAAGCVLRFLPPLTIGKAEVDAAMAIVSGVLAEMEGKA